MSSPEVGKLGPKRRLKETEKALIQLLLETHGDVSRWLSFLDSLEVQTMDDGGMGSLYIHHPHKDRSQRRMGSCLAQIELRDSDGVPALISLDLDQQGDLFELDIFKADFSPLIDIQFPEK